MADYSYGVPSSSTVSGVALDQSQIDNQKLYGVDLYYDVREGSQVDTHVTPAGDYLTVTGLTAYKQSIIRRMISDPGEYARFPDYGAGLRRMVKERANSANIAAMQARVKAQAMKDDRTARVIDVVFEFIDDGVKLLLVVEPKAGPQRPSPLYITIVTDGIQVSTD